MPQATAPESTRDRFIQAANGLFYGKGFHATGLDEIIEAVGVTKTTFYKHFESKDDLAIAVLQRRDAKEIDEWIASATSRGGGNPKGEILALFDLVEEWLSDPNFAGCMFFKAASEYPSPTDPVHQAAMQHGQNLYRELEKRAALAGAIDAKGLAAQLMLLLTGAVLARHATGVPDQAKSARAAAGVLVDVHTR